MGLKTLELWIELWHKLNYGDEWEADPEAIARQARLISKAKWN